MDNCSRRAFLKGSVLLFGCSNAVYGAEQCVNALESEFYCDSQTPYSSKITLRIDQGACTGCAACLDECEMVKIVMQDGKACFDSDEHCVCFYYLFPYSPCRSACPVGAIDFEE
jgi:ferredoxin